MFADPACSFGGAQGVGGGAEIMFRGVRVGVGRCCPTLLVVSAGLKGWVVAPRLCFGLLEGDRQVFADPACSFGGAQGRVVVPRSRFGVFEGDRQVLSYPAYVLDGPEGRAVAPRSRFGVFEGRNAGVCLPRL